MRLMIRAAQTAFLVTVALGFLAACGNGEGTAEDEERTLSIWSFTDELEFAIEEFESRNPNVEVDFTIVPDEDYMTRIRPVLQSGQNAPDVFAGEAAFVRELVESGFWEPLDEEPYNPDLSDMYDYVPQVGTDSDGVLRAISWQTTPGATFYRRSIAEEYLGTDDPDEIGEYFADYDSMLELGRELQEASDGEIHLLPEIGSMINWYLPNREYPWVDDDNVFRFDDAMVDHLEMARTMRQEGLEANREAWTPAWFDGMGEDTDTFAYTLPTWGLHFVLKENAPETEGDWGVTRGPVDYFWGGTWLGMYADSDKKDLAWDFIEMATLDEEFLETWAMETGDFLGNEAVVDRIRDDFSDEFLGGQNHYDFFAERAPNVDGTLITRYDQEIEDILDNARDQYIDDEIDLDTALEIIFDEVEADYPQFEVERR